MGSAARRRIRQGCAVATHAFLRNAVPKLPCHDSVHEPIGLCASGGKVSVCCKSFAGGDWASINVAEATSTANVTVQVNRSLLVKALEFGFSQIDFTDPITPLRFIAPGKQLIVMPLRGEIPPVPVTEEPVDTNNHTTHRKETMPITLDQSRTPAVKTTEEPLPAVQQAVEHIEQIKDTLKGAVRSLNELLETLKQAQRENRSTEREIESVRSTLRSLQKVSI